MKVSYLFITFLSLTIFPLGTALAIGDQTDHLGTKASSEQNCQSTIFSFLKIKGLHGARRPNAPNANGDIAVIDKDGNQIGSGYFSAGICHLNYSW